MSVNIQKQKPIRTYNKTHAHYRSYKPYLIIDFNNRCGYCDAHDRFLGGCKSFHIDHFKPHSIQKFFSLKHVYTNLVYSCPSCNGAKSNKWEDINGFIDPCDPTYNIVIFRNRMGQIKHNGTIQGKYIYSNLNLFLQRHELLWTIEKLERQRDLIGKLLKSNSFKIESKKIKLLEEFHKIQTEIIQYTNLFNIEISH